MNAHSFKWVMQRVTALLLIPLSFWFVYQCISFQYLNYLELKLFFKSYLNSLIFLLMMIAMLIHAKLGCETIVRDYVSDKYIKKIFINLINFIAFLLLSISMIAIIKLSIIV